MFALTNGNPNGAWNLFVIDTTPGDSGAITGGWILTLTLDGDPPVAPAPESLTAEAGSSASFSSQVIGSTPLYYQWCFNGSPLTSGIGPLLRLRNVDPTNAGSYTLVVTNFFGATTSAPATLAVVPPVPRRLVPELRLDAPSGIVSIEVALSLVPAPVWNPLAEVTIANGPEWYFDAAITTPRYYRAAATDTTPSLSAQIIPALLLSGNVSDWLRVDIINRVGPTDAWVSLATVQLTNAMQPFYDTSAPGQPARIYRVTQVPGP